MNEKKNLKKLGSNIIKIRKAKGISQERLAMLAGIDRSFIGRIERGETNPTFLTLLRISNALGCKICDLVYISQGGDDRN